VGGASPDSILPVATNLLPAVRENTSSFTTFARVARQLVCAPQIRVSRVRGKDRAALAGLVSRCHSRLSPHPLISLPPSRSCALPTAPPLPARCRRRPRFTSPYPSRIKVCAERHSHYPGFGGSFCCDWRLGFWVHTALGPLIWDVLPLQWM
jgi:hypothetical protein